MIDLKLPLPAFARAPKLPDDAGLKGETAPFSFVSLMEDAPVATKTPPNVDMVKLPVVAIAQVELQPASSCHEIPIDVSIEGDMAVSLIAPAFISAEPRAQTRVVASVAISPLEAPGIAVSNPPIRQRIGLPGYAHTPIGQRAPSSVSVQPVPAPPDADKAGPVQNISLATPAPAVLHQASAAQPAPTTGTVAGPTRTAPATASLPGEAATAIPRTIRITLRPQELGDVQVMVRQEAGQIRVTIAAETEAGHAALLAKSDTLTALVRDIRAVVPNEVAAATTPNMQTANERGSTPQRHPDDRPHDTRRTLRQPVWDNATPPEPQRRGTYI